MAKEAAIVAYDPSWVVHGLVLNEKNEPVAGASISVKGTSKTVLSNEKGEFIIEIASAQDSLQITYIGYKPLVIVAGSEKNIVVRLEQDVENSSMQEVVVVGYGVQKKINLTGAVSTIEMSKVAESRPITSLSSSLYGLAAGLTVNQGNARPGGDGAALLLFVGRVPLIAPVPW